jgi:hypothetical protein
MANCWFRNLLFFVAFHVLNRYFKFEPEASFDHYY